MANFREEAGARARSDEERLLARRLCDLSDRAERTGALGYTNFLSPEEQAFCGEIARFLPSPLTLDGGFDGAERKIALFGEYGERPLAALSIAHRAPLSHRDLLGAAIGLGVERSVIGDIAAGESESRMVIMRSALDFFLASFDRAGRVKIEVRELDLADFAPPERRFEVATVSVASERLDALVAAAWGLSRERAQGEIARGAVSLNHRQTLEPSRKVAAGDVLSLRGHGKLEVGEVLGTSKRGRLHIEIRKYV